MEPNRREFLKMTMLGASWMSLAGCPQLEQIIQQIANRPVRKDINSLAANDPIIEAYKSAVAQMKNLPTTDPRNWIAQADIHLNHCPHGNWLFLPWHRWYLAYFERICQKLTGMSDFALPYWNWVKDPTVPAAFWGDTSNPLYDGSRSIGPNQAITPSLVGCSVVGGIMGDNNFISFASDSISLGQDQRTNAGYGQLEGTPHNGVHSAIGGNMGTFSSPRDPIFWLHHNMIEKCWVEWQFVRNNPNTIDNNWTDRRFSEFYDQDGNPVNVQVLGSLLLPVLSYQFDNLPVVPSPCPAGDPPPTPVASRAPWSAEWEKFNTVRTTAEQDELKAKAQMGAIVRLDVMQSFPLGAPVLVTVGRPASLKIVAPTASVRSALSAGERTFIRFGGVTLNHTMDFFVKVFVDKSDATASTPDSDPHFAGSFAFFDHAHDGSAAADRGNFHLDVSAVVKRLGLEGQSIEVNVVLAPFPNRQLKTNTLEIASTEIQIVKDVIERRMK